MREQIASILSQLSSTGRLLIRDDGSTDETVCYIKSFNDPRISLSCGKNVGFVKSFLTLITTAPDDADMIMLSDQDDIWLPEKIERAWNVIKNSGDTPTLYCSRLQLVNSELQPIGLSPSWPRTPSFENALTENIVTGCTAALNPAAVKLVGRFGDSKKIYFHDWWLYLVVSCYGIVIVDPVATILYRQHGKNMIGMQHGLKRYWTILRFLRKTNWIHIMFNQIENLNLAHGQIIPFHQKLLLKEKFNPHNWKSIVRLIFQPKRLRQTILSDILFRGILILDIITGRGLLPK